MKPLDVVLARFQYQKRNGSGWSVRCPAHYDRVASLSVSEGDDGRVLLHCHAGCALDAVLTAASLEMGDLFPPRDANGSRPVVATYDYVDEAGTLLYQVVRYAPKDFLQRRPDGNGGWVWKLGDVRRVIYRLPEVLEGVHAGRQVVVVEGERDADRIGREGFVATTNAGGAGKWRPEYAAALRGAKVAIIGDNDAPGRAHAEQVARALVHVASVVKVVELPGLADKGDVSDWLDAGHTADELKALIEATAPVPVSTVVDTPAAAALRLVQAGETGSSTSPEARATAQPIPVGPPEDGAELLDEIERYIRRFVYLGEHEGVVVTTFLGHCHGIDAFYTTPRIKVGSAEPDCGKTMLVVDVMGPLLPADPILTPSISPAALYRTLRDRTPTIVLDEVDNTFARKGAGDSESLSLLLAVLNSGYRRGVTVPRCMPPNQEVVNYPTFAPVVTAGIRSKMSHAYETRCIHLEMQRPLPDRYPEPFEWSAEVLAVAHGLRDRLAAWTATRLDDLRTRPECPKGIVGRKAEIWVPLLSVAEVAGGEWPERAREAARALGLGIAQDNVENISHELLADTRAVFGERDRLHTAALLSGLNALEERPWHTWNNGVGIRPLDFAKRIVTHYRLHRSKSMDIDGKNAKGYEKLSFVDAWERFLPPLEQLDAKEPPVSRQARQTLDAATVSGISRPVNQESTETPETLQPQRFDGLTGSGADQGVNVDDPVVDPQALPSEVADEECFSDEEPPEPEVEEATALGLLKTHLGGGIVDEYETQEVSP